MPLELIGPAHASHPITELHYELVTQPFDIAGHSLSLTTLANVENSIDQVFSWLESKGRDASEIESLAPYFGVVWPSALALSGYLVRELSRRTFSGQKLLELGCGLAIPSIIASKSRVTCLATDHHPDVPRFLERNVRQNEPCFLSYQHLPGRGPGTVPDDLRGTFDFVMASDVLYERQLVEIFADKCSAFAAASATCVVADPGRPYIQEFVNAMINRGWRDYLEPWTVPYQGQQRDIFVMVFTR